MKGGEGGGGGGERGGGEEGGGVIPICIDDFEVELLGEQLTLWSFEKYKKMMSMEFYHQCWTKKEKKRDAPNLLEMIGSFNRVSEWITSEIVQGL